MEKVNVMVEEFVVMMIVVLQWFVNEYLIANVVKLMEKYTVDAQEWSKPVQYVEQMIAANNDDNDAYDENMVQDLLVVCTIQLILPSIRNCVWSHVLFDDYENFLVVVKHQLNCPLIHHIHFRNKLNQ